MCKAFFVWNNIVSQFISSSLGRAATTRKMSCWWFSGRTRLRRNQCVSWHLQEKLRRCLAGFDLRKKYSKHFIVKYVRKNSIFLTTDRKKSKIIIYPLKKIVSNNDKKKYLKIIDKVPLIFFPHTTRLSAMRGNKSSRSRWWYSSTTCQCVDATEWTKR